MDFNFGEIVEPTSRAFYDDYEDPSLNHPFKKPIWMWNTEDGKPPTEDETIQNLIIVDGELAYKIMKPSILKEKVPFAKLDGHKVQLFEIDNFTLCVIEEEELNYFTTITQMLGPWIQAAVNCTIVSLQKLWEYKADEVKENEVIVRSIHSQFSDIPHLDAPNFVTGTGAGIATYRHSLDLPFCCYIIYIDDFDIFSIRAILNLLKRLQLPHDESVPLKRLYEDSNMYM